MSALASTSRAFFRGALAQTTRRQPCRALATAAETQTTTAVEEERPEVRESAATYQAPLPGSAVLPDMFKAPEKLPGQDLVGGLSGADAYARPVISGGPRKVRSYNPYKLHVLSTRNNTFLTLSAIRQPTHPAFAKSRGPEQDEQEFAVGTVSGGTAGFKGAQRSTYDAGVEVTLQMVKRIREMINPPVLPGGKRPKTMGPAPTEIELVFKGFGSGREAVFRTLMTGDADVVRSLIRRVTDATPIPVPGTRPKKRRMV
ncbi:37S ribosomal protein [Rhodotorula toruloides]|uniref:37S ribosomal protein n=1 Tax=Rhodotorula toruloides TaxID=5286 RepID=A0A511KML7_RHOTO|nr:37S ribosomal protein [Rhodotorula toruloides]